MKFQKSKTKQILESRRLYATWTMEFAKDLSTEIDKQILEEMSNNIAKKLDNQIMQEVLKDILN
jgi:hypothetical protein